MVNGNVLIFKSGREKFLIGKTLHLKVENVFNSQIYLKINFWKTIYTRNNVYVKRYSLFFFIFLDFLHWTERIRILFICT